MKALGVGLVTRKLGNKSSPTVTITEEAGEFTMKQESLVKTSEIKFRIGQEFDEVTADGRQGKFVHRHNKTQFNNSIFCWNKMLDKYSTRGSHNNKKIPYKGSAIFIHLTNNYKPTAGCIALRKKDFEIMLKLINQKTLIKIG